MTTVRRVLRPASDTSPAFDLAYVRTGPRSRTPFVVVPGGPGLGSVLPYRGFRRWAASGGLDLIMVEHRGVGFSRNDVHGAPLRHAAMWVTEVIDDIAAVLDAEGVERAFFAGSSYGSYLATSFGARHPERVAGMVLDSALQSADDLTLERALLRELFWQADTPVAAAVQQLWSGDGKRRRRRGGGVEDRELTDVVRAAYELGGERLLEPVLAQRLRQGCSPAWWALGVYARRDESIARVPGHYEFDIAGAIGFRELNYGAVPDGVPLDPALTYAPLAARFPAFAGEPFELSGEVSRFSWPMVLLAGRRDVRTPAAIAERVANGAQDSVLVRIDNGHSALDTHPAALLNAMRELAAGRQQRLPALAARLDRLPRRGFAARLPGLLGAMTRFERTLG